MHAFRESFWWAPRWRKKNKEDWNDGARPQDNERFRVGPLESDARQAFLNGIRSCNGGIAH